MGQFRPDIDPLKLPQYFWFYRHNGYVMGWLLKGVGGVSAAGGLIAALVYFRRQDALHGAARWASKAEARAASLSATEGLLPGTCGGDYIPFGGNEKVLLEVPTSEGKGVGAVFQLTTDQHDLQDTRHMRQRD